MATLQRIVISALLILTATFLFFAQTAQAAKGPRITSKVFFTMQSLSPSPGRILIDTNRRSTSISSKMERA